MTTFRQNMAAFMAPGLKVHFATALDNYPKQFEQIFNMNTSDKAFEVGQGVVDLGLMPEKLEGKGIQYDDPTQGYNNTYVHRTYALGYRVTREAVEDDQYKILGPRMSRFLGKSAGQTREIQAASLFNNGFGNVGPDGVSLFNAAHPLERGGSYGNRPTTPTALSQTALQLALTSFRRTVDGTGKLIQLRPKFLVVPPELEFYARELINSTLKPDGNNNNVNSIQGTLDIVVWDYLTNPTAWFLTADKMEHSFQWYDRRKLAFDSSDDPDTEDSKFKASYRASWGWDDFRGVYGSPGS